MGEGGFAEYQCEQGTCLFPGRHAPPLCLIAAQRARGRRSVCAQGCARLVIQSSSRQPCSTSRGGSSHHQVTLPQATWQKSRAPQGGRRKPPLLSIAADRPELGRGDSQGDSNTMSWRRHTRAGTLQPCEQWKGQAPWIHTYGFSTIVLRAPSPSRCLHCVRYALPVVQGFLHCGPQNYSLPAHRP